MKNDLNPNGPHRLAALFILALVLLWGYSAIAQTPAGGYSSPLAGSGGTITSNSPYVFNVMNPAYGAKNDMRGSDNCTTATSTTQVCTDLNFTSADVGKTMICSSLWVTRLPRTTIASVTNSTTVVTVGASNNNLSNVTCVVGTLNDTAIAAAQTAALAATTAVSNKLNLTVPVGDRKSTRLNSSHPSI